MNTINCHFEISSKKRPDKRSCIMLRLTQHRKMKRISTHLFVAKADINCQAPFGKWVKPTDSAYILKNRELKEIIIKAEAAPAEMEKLGKIPTIDSVASFLKGGGELEQQTDFIEFAEKVTANMKITDPVSSWKKYNNTIHKLKSYLGKRKLQYSDINVAFLNEYQLHLKKIGNGANTIQKEFKVLSAILNKLIDLDKFPQERNPFPRLAFKGAKTNKVKLSEEEIKKIEELKLPVGSAIWDAKNTFLFSFYNAGIRFGDLVQLKWSNIKEDRIVYQMGKTGLHKSIKLVQQPTAILNLYKNEAIIEDDYIFPILDKKYHYEDKFFLFNQISSKNTIVNKNLKKIAKLIGLNKPLSTHLARHAFADIARTRKMGVYDISKALGHSSIKVTETYLKSMDLESLDESMGKMFQE